MTLQPIEHLFEGALEVVNRSLEANRRDGGLGPAREGHQTKVLVYEDDPSAPSTAFALEYRDGRLEMMHRWQSDVESEWKVSRDHLNALVTHPEEYVEDPARLGMDWLAGPV
jgi:hypothetical protein